MMNDIQKPSESEAEVNVAGNAVERSKSVGRITYDDSKFFLNYKGCMVHYPWYKSLPEVETFEAKAGDVCLISFPRSGKLWMSAVITLILNDANPACLHVEKTYLSDMCPFLEECRPAGIDNPELRSIFRVKTAPSPRLYATHLPSKALPVSILQKAKVIYILRNPKDVLVSMHNFFCGLKVVGYNHDLPYLANEMAKDDGRVLYGPYFDHVKGYWQLRELPNILMCSYERLKRDMKGEVKKIAAFLDKTFTDAQIELICRECSFDEMKANPSTNRSEMQKYGVMDFEVLPYMNKGVSGGWREKIDKESNEKLDQWIAENMARPELQGFQLDFE